jgi:hypothetical protein
MSVFTPYTVKELEAFNATFDPAKQDPVTVSVNGYIIHGRKRFEAARLRLETARRGARVKLDCVVYYTDDNYEIWKKTCEEMVVDAAHTHPEDVEVAHEYLTRAFPKGEKQLRRLIPMTGRFNDVETFNRRKLYGSPIVTFAVRREFDQGLNGLSTHRMSQLIRMAEQAFGGGRQVGIMPDRIPHARQYLERLVSAAMRDLPLPDPTSKYAVVKRLAETEAAREYFKAYAQGDRPSGRTTGRRFPTLEVVEKDNLEVEEGSLSTKKSMRNIWKELEDVLREKYLAPLLEGVDPALHPAYYQRTVEILERNQQKMQKILNEMKRDLQTMKRRVYEERSVRLAPSNDRNRLDVHYSRLGTGRIDEDTEPQLALALVKKAYRTAMQTSHPDKGGDHAVATEVNTSYQMLVKHWEDKRRNAS